MNDIVARDLERFYDDLKPVEEGYPFLSFRYFAYEESGEWRVVMANLQIEAFPEPTEIHNVHQSGRIAVGFIRHRGTVKMLREIIDRVKSDRKLIVHGQQMRLPDDEERGSLGSYYRPFAAYPLPQGILAPSVRLIGTRSQGVALERAKLDMELKASHVPYHTLAELLSEFGLPAQLPEQPYIEISALPVAELLMSPEGCKIEGGTAVFTVLRSRWITPHELRLGWRLVKDNVVQGRGSVDGSRMQWPDSGSPYLKGEFKLPVSERCVVQAFLSYRGRLQHESAFADRDVIYNSRRAAHEAFDPKLKVLEWLLFDPANRKLQDSRKFEEGVTYLLSLLGFRATHYAQPLDNAPDIVASTVRGDIALVECTTGTIASSGKLGKLAGRTEAVRTQLASSAHQSTRVLPVIVTALPRAEVFADLPEAAKLGITVLTSEDLRSAIPRTLYQGDPHLELFEQAYAAIASQGQRPSA